MLYLAQVIICSGILWIVYMLLLRNKPIHSFNRAYLLSAVLLPLIVPFIKFPSLAKQYLGNETPLGMRLPEVTIDASAQPQAASTIQWVLAGYVLVSLVLFVFMVRQWIKIHSVIKRSERIEKEDYILLLNTGYGPGSWGNNVFLPGNEINDTIIKHELAHVHQKHSADVIFINLVQCLFWPNIFLQAIKKELRQVHEFQADAAVDMNRKDYGELLVSSVFDSCTLPMAHTFIIHPIKRRIMMLNKRKNKVLGITFGIAAITLTTFMLGNMVALQSCTTKKWEAKDEVSSKNINDTKDLPPGVIKLAEKMPQCPYNLGEYIGSHLVYPADAMSRGKEGRVNVFFVVREDGTITNAIVKHLVNKQTGDTLDASLVQAAIDVVSNMPKWIPGEDKGKKVAVQYVIPISFKLGDKDDKTSSVDKPNTNRKILHPYNDATPLMNLMKRTALTYGIIGDKVNEGLILASLTGNDVLDEARLQFYKLGNDMMDDMENGRTEKLQDGFKQLDGLSEKIGQLKDVNKNWNNDQNMVNPVGFRAVMDRRNVTPPTE